MFYMGLKGSGYRSTRLFNIGSHSCIWKPSLWMWAVRRALGPCGQTCSPEVGGGGGGERERPPEELADIKVGPSAKWRRGNALPFLSEHETLLPPFSTCVSSPTSMLLAQPLYLTCVRGFARAQPPAMTLDDWCLFLTTNPPQGLGAQASEI